MKVFLVAALLCTIVYGQTPKPCDSPPEWEGRVFQHSNNQCRTVSVTGSWVKEVKVLEENCRAGTSTCQLSNIIDQSKQFERYGFLSYDATNTRTRFIEEIIIGKEKDYYEELYLHNVGLEYRLNLQTKKCNVTQLTKPFRPIGIPSDAHFYEEHTIGWSGHPDENIAVATFGGNRTGEEFFGTVTLPGCIPVVDGYVSNNTGYIQTDFYNMHVGIADPSVFIPPAECVQ